MGGKWSRTGTIPRLKREKKRGKSVTWEPTGKKKRFPFNDKRGGGKSFSSLLKDSGDGGVSEVAHGEEPERLFKAGKTEI